MDYPDIPVEHLNDEARHAAGRCYLDVRMIHGVYELYDANGEAWTVTATPEALNEKVMEMCALHDRIWNRH